MKFSLTRAIGSAKTRVFGPVLTLLLCVALPRLSAQETPGIDFQTCWDGCFPTSGGSCTVGMGTCPESGASYSFPQVVFFNATSVSISPASAGTVLSLNPNSQPSGGTPVVCIHWNVPGFHQVTVFYGSGHITQSRTRTVYVSLANTNYARHTLSNVSNCAFPNSQFTITRVTQSSGPVKKHCVQVHELDANDAIIEPAVFNSGWKNSDITTSTFNSTTPDKNGKLLNFETGKRYKVRLLTQSACGQDDVTGSFVIFGAGSTPPLVDFDLNGSSGNPVQVYSCNQSPMIMNDLTDYPGCNPVLTTATINIAAAATCNAAINGGASQTVTVPFASSYNLRALFPQLTAQPGLYRVSYSLFGAATGLTYGPVVHCMNINSLDASNAEFRLIGPNNSPSIPRNNIDITCANTQLGQLSCGLYLQNTTSQIPSLDYYRVEIWKNIGGNNLLPALFTSANLPIDASHPWPTGYQFNAPDATNGYFFGLTAAEVASNRYRVRLTVHNACGETFQESLFRILSGCQFCFQSNSGSGSQIEGADEGVAERASDASKSGSVLVSPNPVDDIFNLHFETSQPGSGLFEVFDAAGRLMTTRTFEISAGSVEMEESFDTSNWPAGMYTWRLVHQQTIKSGKLVKY